MTTGEPAAEPSPPPLPAAPRRPLRRGRLALVVGGAVAAVAAALAVSVALDQPTGSAPPDVSAPIVAGPVVIDPTERLNPTHRLPPLALVINDPLPASLRSLGAAARLDALRARAASGNRQALLQLATNLQSAGRQQDAAAVYRRMLAANRNDPEAQTGLALVTATAQGGAIGRAAVTLSQLYDEFPSDQVVAFNRGWLAIYRRDAGTALLAWSRAISLNPNSNLGRTAMTLAAALRSPAASGMAAGATTAP